MFSLGFQLGSLRGFEGDDKVLFTGGLESAKAVVTVLVDSLVPTGYMRPAPDSYFMITAFASAFMLELLRPEFSRFIVQDLKAEIYQLIERLIDTIGSPQIATDEFHAPKLYPRFLVSLLAKHKRESRTLGNDSTKRKRGNSRSRSADSLTQRSVSNLVPGMFDQDNELLDSTLGLIMAPEDEDDEDLLAGIQAIKILPGGG